MSVPLILTSPHSGNIYPDFYIKNLKTPLDFCRSIEDMFVNEFIEGLSNNDILVLSGKYSRSVIDLNRSNYEIDKSLIGDDSRIKSIDTFKVRSGIGLIPTQTPRGRIIFKDKFSSEDFRYLVEDIYLKWHKRLKSEINKKHLISGKVFLIDFHSMSSENGVLPDIVLGNVNGLTCKEENIRFISKYLNNLGYSVAINIPYAGGYITKNYNNKSLNIETLQIEINKDLYMDENRFLKNKGFDLLKINLDKMINEFANYFVSDSNSMFAAE